MLLFALTIVAQPVYYTLVCVFMSQSALRPHFPPRGSSSHFRTPETLEFVCMLSSLLFFNLGRGSSGLSIEGQRPGKVMAMET